MVHYWNIVIPIFLHDLSKYIKNCIIGTEEERSQKVKDTVNADMTKETIDFSIYNLPEEEETKKEGAFDKIGKSISEVQSKVAEGWDKGTSQLKEGAEKTGKTFSNLAKSAKAAAETGSKKFKETYEAARNEAKDKTADNREQ